MVIITRIFTKIKLIGGKVNYKVILDLCCDAVFVRSIQRWYEFNNGDVDYGNQIWDRLILSTYVGDTISVWNWDKIRYEKVIITLKEILYARDLIVHYNLDKNFELSNKYPNDNRDYSTRTWTRIRDDKTINRLLGFVRNPKDSRPTANDIYERNIQAEINWADEVRACCSPYDCMHNENGERDSGEIWTKIGDK
tara:strand:+ start:2236 stop:2820 length:585 start_codon:yes stop_codon:yes gene_type:complete